MMCFGGTRIEKGLYGTVVLRRHVGCVGNDVMAGGHCFEHVVCLTRDERRRSRTEKRRLLAMKWQEVANGSR